MVFKRGHNVPPWPQELKKSLAWIGLTKTLELAVAVERATHDSTRLQSTQLRSTDQVHWVRQGQRGRARGKDDEEGRHCFRCGSRLHDEGKCRFRKEKCYQSGKTGHICRTCWQKNAAGVGQAGQERHKQGQRVFSVTNESSDSSSDRDHDGMYYLCRVGENELGRVNTDPITVSVVLDGQSTEMEIDTGACVSVMAESRFKKLWPEEKRPV